MPSFSLSDLNASLSIGEWIGLIMCLKCDASFPKRQKMEGKSKNSDGIATNE
jgi:hypothetical protein